MPPAIQLDRQLARLSGVDLATIRYRRLREEHRDRIDSAMATLESVADRLAFVRPPFDLTNVAACVDDFDADIILLDYVQRILPPGDHGDKRGSVNAAMDHLRRFADAGMAVLVVSAVGRTKDSKGRASYDGGSLSLASFRESSELEFGADDAFILVHDPKVEGQVILRHLKSRHGRATDLTLRFHGDYQRFESVSGSPGAGASGTRLDAALAAIWNQTPAAADEDAGGAAE